MKLSWFISDITNVELVEKRDYEYWISLKLWKTGISVSCLFVDMKWLQNETSWINTDLIRNLKIKIISISVLNWYFFKNFHFHIKSNLIGFMYQFFHLAHPWVLLKTIRKRIAEVSFGTHLFCLVNGCARIQGPKMF